MEQEDFYWVWLTCVNGVGPVKAHKLLEKYKTAKIIYEQRYDIEAIAKSNMLEQSQEKAERIIEICKKRGIEIISYCNSRYFTFWKEYYDFPVLLYLKGKEWNINAHYTGIVGARRCSVNGKQKAVEISECAVRGKSIVVSGMAKGVDSYAHTACIKNGGKTIAVLGNGVDICYPTEHKYLYDEICNNGSLVSEYPPGTRPNRYNFPRRNRIIAGFSDKIYVIEAGKNSGTTSTVEAAIKYGKKIEYVDCYGHEK